MEIIAHHVVQHQKKLFPGGIRYRYQKKIVICFGVGFVAFQALNFVIAYFMELTDSISGA